MSLYCHSYKVQIAVRLQNVIPKLLQWYPLIQKCTNQVIDPMPNMKCTRWEIQPEFSTPSVYAATQRPIGHLSPIDDHAKG